MGHRPACKKKKKKTINMSGQVQSERCFTCFIDKRSISRKTSLFRVVLRSVVLHTESETSASIPAIIFYATFPHRKSRAKYTRII